LGRKTGAALKAINFAIVTPRCNRSHPLPSGGDREENNHRLAMLGYVCSYSKVNSAGGLQPQRGDR
jgi:hypothetical protein